MHIEGWHRDLAGYLRLQYLAGLGSIAVQAAPIYQYPRRRRCVPRIVSEETNRLLRHALNAEKGGK